MTHDFKIKYGLAQCREKRKEKPNVSGFFYKARCLDAFCAPLRLGVKTVLCSRRAGWVVPVMLIALVSGCALTSKGPSVTVTRLNDGRDGFVIRETPVMDAAVRTDFERAVGMMNAGKNDAAIELLTRVIDRSPGVTAPHIDIAMAYMRIGKPELAEQHFKTALELVPHHPVASNEYGLLLRRSGRFQEAREIYEKAIGVFPEYLPARKNLGILCDLYLNDPACALRQFEVYSRAMPADEQVKIWIAELHMRAGKN